MAKPCAGAGYRIPKHAHSPSSSCSVVLLKSGVGLGCDQVESEAVHAVPLAGGRRTVGEQVAQVRAAATAAHLGAHHAVAGVVDELDGVGCLGVVEARPPAVGFVLGGRI